MSSFVRGAVSQLAVLDTATKRLRALDTPFSSIGNLAVSYEKAGFSFKTAWNFHGKYIDAVGEEAAADVYYDDHVQVDITASQRLTKNITVYADALNLTNAPLRYFIGTWDRPVQEEYYRWWMMFGARVNF